MKIEVGKKYKLVLEINGRILTYIANIIDIDETFISFIDINNNKFNYNINKIISYEEVER